MGYPACIKKQKIRENIAPQRDVIVGGAGKSFSILGQWFPGLGDMIVGAKPMFELNKRAEPPRDRPDSLYEAGSGLEERGSFPGIPILEGSQYTQIVQSPTAKIAIAASVALGVFAWALRSSSRR